MHEADRSPYYIVMEPTDHRQGGESIIEPDRMNDTAARITESILADRRIRRLSAIYMPNRDAIVSILDKLEWLVFPGFFGPRALSEHSMREHVQRVLDEVSNSLFSQITGALRYEQGVEWGGPAFEQQCAASDRRARAIVADFIDRIPEIRRNLSLDVQAAYDGDPAAHHVDETIFCYPGVHALFVHRIAHELYRMEVPLIPRMMAEHAHSATGIDIHPGAKIGRSFFIDHGTGVVIGETTVIGDHCKVYQGVTLGAKSFPRDERGHFVRGAKRHPTLEDHVTVYAGATILGGDTIIGAGSIVNGGVFLVRSVPAGHVVRAPKIELKMRANPEMPPPNYHI